MRAIHSLAMLCITLCAASGSSTAAEQTATNLVSNSSFEKTRDEDLSGGYFNKALKDGCDFGSELIATIPKNFDQFNLGKRLKIVQSTAGKEVHSGQKAVLFNGRFYINDILKVKDGDAFTVKFYAKGDGKTRVRFVVRDAEGKPSSNALPKLETVTPDEWTLVTHDLKIEDPKARTANILLEAEGDITMDDLSITADVALPIKAP